MAHVPVIGAKLVFELAGKVAEHAILVRCTSPASTGLVRGVPRGTVLMAYAEGDREGQAFIAAFREELKKFGWAEGRNIRIDFAGRRPTTR